MAANVGHWHWHRYQEVEKLRKCSATTAESNKQLCALLRVYVIKCGGQLSISLSTRRGWCSIYIGASARSGRKKGVGDSVARPEASSEAAAECSV